MDDLQVVRFNAKEATVAARSGGRAASHLSRLASTRTRREPVIWMNNGNRPPGSRTGHPRGVLRRDVAGKVTVGPADQAYVFDIPQPLAAQASRTSAPPRFG
jgi:hypothetical protein